MRHTNGYYIGCYQDTRKSWSCGETMTLKEALDLWWNSVRIFVGEDLYVCYKNAYTDYGTYELDGLNKSCLKKNITLDKEWDYDSDGFPFVYAKFTD